MTPHNALDEAFDRARREGRGVLIPYLTAGYPDPDTFVDLALTVLDAGADALEIGIPFSDPLLDGPSIQRSQQQALERGVTPGRCLEYAARIGERADRPLLFMGAFNPMLAYGIERLCREGAPAGVAGLIVPDVPFEEQGELRDAAHAWTMHVIQIVAPTSTRERMARACAAASGFVYCISVVGVTGARRDITSTARPLVQMIRSCTEVPVAVGFGIAGPQQARDVASFADGVIVGSALINLLAETPARDRTAAVRQFVGSLRDALSGHRDEDRDHRAAAGKEPGA